MQQNSNSHNGYIPVVKSKTTYRFVQLNPLLLQTPSQYLHLYFFNKRYFEHYLPTQLKADFRILSYFLFFLNFLYLQISDNLLPFFSK